MRAHLLRLSTTSPFITLYFFLISVREAEDFAKHETLYYEEMPCYISAYTVKPLPIVFYLLSLFFYWSAHHKFYEL